MYETFIDLITTSAIQIILRIILLPAITVLLVFIVHAIWLKIDKEDLPFTLHSKMVLLKSIILIAASINLYWLLIIKFNGLYLFTWNIFSYKLNNIYLMLSPLFISYVVLVIMYFRTQSKIKKTV